jgi:hypothetical protein
MIEHCGTMLPDFDQGEWARLEANLRLFAALSPEEWQRWGIHAERGRIQSKIWRGRSTYPAGAAAARSGISW